MCDVIQSLIPVCHQCGIRPQEIGSYTPSELRSIFETEETIRKRDLEIGDRRAARICAVLATIHGGKKKFSESDFLPKYNEPKKEKPVMTQSQQFHVIKRLNKVFGGVEK